MLVIVGSVQRLLNLASHRAAFMWVIFAIPATAAFGHALAPNQAFFKGHDLGVLLGLGLAFLGLLLWLPYRADHRWPALVWVFLSLTLIAWFYQILRTQLDGSLFNLTAFAVPVLLLLIALKPITFVDLRIALLILGYTLIAISLATLVLGQLNLMPNGFNVSDAGVERTGFLSMFGISNRWGGPFGSVNYSSPVGGLLVVLGLNLAGRHRYAFVLSGLAILVLGQGRTAIVATVLAVGVFLIFSDRLRRSRYRVQIWVATVVITAVAAITYVRLFDATFNGRTPIWQDFIQLLDTNPLAGVGTTGILAYVAENVGEPGFVPHTHAHSVLLDAAVRHGLTLTAVALAIYVVAAIAGIRALPTHGSGPLAIVAFVIAAGLAETIYSWNYWSVYAAALTYVAMTGGLPDLTTSVGRSPPERSLSWRGDGG